MEDGVHNSDDEDGERNCESLQVEFSQLDQRFTKMALLSAQEKLQLLRPKVHCIRNHFEELKDDSLMNSFSESWMFWKCCICETGEKFADEDSFLDHLKLQHIVPEIDPKWLQTVIPEIDPKRQDVWKPVDTVELANMLEVAP